MELCAPMILEYNAVVVEVVYLLVGNARVLEGVLVQQVTSLRGELDTRTLDEERVVVLDKEPSSVIGGTKQLKRLASGCILHIPVSIERRRKGLKKGPWCLPGKISRHV